MILFAVSTIDSLAPAERAAPVLWVTLVGEYQDFTGLVGVSPLQDNGDDVAGDEYPSVPFGSKVGKFGAEEDDAVIFV